MSAKDFLGNGWRFPIVPDALGQLGFNREDENVEQSLRTLLLTSQGERVMRPDFGTRVDRYVFAPGSPQFLRLVENAVKEAVRDWEPRVDLDEVRAEMSDDPETDTTVTVAISYRVRQSNTKQNLVFPFYLGAVGVP
jgi:Bacteriophage baseplate protein W